MLPVEHNDPINAKILAVSEDKIEGFVREPFEEIAGRSGVGVEVVMARIAAMLRAKTIRRVRQTLLATNLAEGALVAWNVPEEKIDAAFDWMFQRDPFSGHVVLRVELSDHEWNILLALKREFTPEEIKPSPWITRANEAGVSLQEFCRVAEDLNARKIVGRFSTFLEHVKPSVGGVRVTRFNALFHWAVPAGRVVETGGEVGRHHILTHCYWREAGPEFRNVNIMAVAHGTDKRLLLEHKAAIDQHLRACEIPVSYTNVFWGGRSEIKPSEISPRVYHAWLSEQG